MFSSTKDRHREWAEGSRRSAIQECAAGEAGVQFHASVFSERWMIPCPGYRLAIPQDSILGSTDSRSASQEAVFFHLREEGLRCSGK
jgi:hypothetical protein